MSKIKIPKDLQIEVNSQKGVLWKHTATSIKQKIEIGKIQAELDEVVLEYCEKKVKEDQKEVEKGLNKN